MCCPAAACECCLVSAGETHCCSGSSQSYAGAIRQADPNMHILSSLSLSKPHQPSAQVSVSWDWEV